MTTKENIQHAWDIGLKQASLGADSPVAKYTNEQIHHLCQLLEERKKTYDEISALTGVPKGVISNIRGGRRWLSISAQYDISAPNIIGENHHNSRYTSAQVSKVCELIQSGGYTYEEITNLTGVTKAGIASIKFKDSWRHISDAYNI